MSLTHWGRVTHICVSKLAIIGSDNGLSPGRRQVIIWTNAGILLIGSLGTNFSEILIEILTFSFKKMHLKISSAKWRPFCLGLNVLTKYWNSVTIGSPAVIFEWDSVILKRTLKWKQNCPLSMKIPRVAFAPWTNMPLKLIWPITQRSYGSVMKSHGVIYCLLESKYISLDNLSLSGQHSAPNSIRRGHG